MTAMPPSALPPMETNVLFFDIGGTLADASALSGVTLTVRPNVLQSLQRLRSAGARLGIISNIGTLAPDAVKAALTACGLMPYFEPALIVFGVKDAPAIFLDAALRAGLGDRPNRCAYIGESPEERDLAIQAGLAALAPGVVLA
ncbi:HAD family hydrolase [Azospirillum soli]|uniref:HAD family hydrolase n=1 Tax=Azospirillum soli TaxID=1304799 RepID=UPI001AE5CAD7|nr:HAD family hydrolase [Azospirillum soli]MBP2315831.1 FMN phosphatase YigB (HAD superfamily) [Azospirillum soli]